MAYTLSAEELCGKVVSWWERSVEAEVGIEMAAIHSDGNPSWSFLPFVTDQKDRFKVRCSW